MPTMNSLQDVLIDQLADLRSAEQQLTTALPQMASAASDPKLREAFEHHLEQTRGHLERLDQVFSDIGVTPPNETCAAMQGLIREGQEIINSSGDPTAKDAALIAAAQRVEHYEIAAYGTVRTLADQLDYDDAKSLLNDTLDEESKADKLLTKIATGGMLAKGVNQKAASR
jgi:ferritin-like metal-binding protein YciE